MSQWLIYSLLTVASWGVYGIFLHTGQTAMADPVNGRYKAFLFVAIVQHPPAGGYGGIKPQFYLGILLAALGGFMVTMFKPNPPTPAKPTAIATNPAAPQSH